MKRIGWLITGCAVWAMSIASLWGQAAPVQVRVRAIAGEDGKVEVVEERIEGDPKEDSEAKKFRDPKTTVADVLAAAAKSIGATVSVTRFARLKVGETA